MTDKICTYCGSPFRVPPSRDKTAKYCSQSCRSIVVHTQHGLSEKVPEYFVWEAMRQRCMNPNHPKYWRYGGRGISIDARWDDFVLFFADVGSKPTPAHQLERIDNDKGYGPDNCKWATRTEQQRNTRRSIWITHNGLTLTLPEWADRLGLSKNLLGSRYVRGMPPEMVLFQGYLPSGTFAQWKVVNKVQRWQWKGQQ